MIRRMGAVVAVALALVGAGCADDTPPAGQDTSGPAPMRLELSAAEARPGQLLEVRVIAPGEHGYGTDATIEHLGPDGQWTPTYHTRMADSADPEAFPLPTGYASYEDKNWLTLLLERKGDRWWTIELPKELEPGRYRIATEVFVAMATTGTPTYSAELLVTA